MRSPESHTIALSALYHRLPRGKSLPGHGRKGNPVQVRNPHPVPLRQARRMPLQNRDVPDGDAETVIDDLVAEFRHLSGAMQVRKKLLAGQLPEIRHAALHRGAFHKEDAGVPLQNGEIERHVPRLPLFRLDRQFPLGSGGAGGTDFRCRA
jgi:hypothetical protein